MKEIIKLLTNDGNQRSVLVQWRDEKGRNHVLSQCVPAEFSSTHINRILSGGRDIEFIADQNAWGWLHPNQQSAEKHLDALIEFSNNTIQVLDKIASNISRASN